MPVTTLRNYLSTSNPEFTLQSTEHPSTTDQPCWDEIEGKQEWADFTLEQIDLIFREVLDHEFELPEQPTVLPMQLEIRDERSFESVLLGYNCIIVNTALKAACEFLRLPQTIWLVGSYARPPGGERIRPHWAGIVAGNESKVLAGESKYTQRKFSLFPDIFSLPADDRWEDITDKCLQQKLSWDDDKWIDAESPSRWLAKNRPTRHDTTASQPLQGQGAALSSSPSAPPSSPGYTDYGYPDTNMKPLQLCSIRWDAQGMTFNLALWAIHMVSAIQNKVEASYPKIGSDRAHQIFRQKYEQSLSS